MPWRRLAVAALLLGLAACREASSAPPAAAIVRRELPTKRVILYGDSRPAVTGERFFTGRSDPAKERAMVIDQIAREKPDLIIHSGDLVARGSSDSHWKTWDETHKPILDARIPFHVALGNHEYAGDSKEGLGYFHSRFPAQGGGRWHAVHAGPILFVMLDSNFDELTKPFVDAQDAWFGRMLKDAEADASIRAVIAVTHHPPYTNSTTHGPSEETRRRFADTAATCSKFRLYLAGHVHNYERFQVGGVNFIVSGGGGAPSTGVSTSNFRTTPAYIGPEVRPFHYLQMTLQESGATIDAMMLQLDGSWKSGDQCDFRF